MKGLEFESKPKKYVIHVPQSRTARLTKYSQLFDIESLYTEGMANALKLFQIW